jgi:SnoaL-like domain
MNSDAREPWNPSGGDDMNMLRIAVVFSLLLALMAIDRKVIQELINRFVDAGNRHDAKAFAAVFAEDFTNWRGTGATGRSKIEEFHAPMFTTIFKHSQKYTDIRIRFVRPMSPLWMFTPGG